MESRDAYFDRVYAENASRLKRFLVARIRAVSDMEDIYQEVWKRFYERTRMLRPAEPMAYLTRIAKGELAKRYRSGGVERRLTELLSAELPDAQPPFEPASLDRLEAAEVWRIVKSEPLLSYQSFVLYYGFDQSLRQIARALSISEDAARFYRTRERIRSEWKGADEK
ncbi:MAG: sigma-70 family RNA polymerase sigma factor [Clostridia bacterium]|nr:sigma-70 family RNA polymerase sigma factor [Clostridia bacterium]